MTATRPLSRSETGFARWGERYIGESDQERRACREVKPLDDFPVSSKMKNGRNPWCRECRNAKRRSRHVPKRDFMSSNCVVCGISFHPMITKKGTLRRTRAGAIRRVCSDTCGVTANIAKGYGIDPAVYVALTRECEICGTREGRIVLDHDHSRSGVDAIRGGLCSTCNSGIGMLKDSPELLERAINYLRRVNRDDRS